MKNTKAVFLYVLVAVLSCSIVANAQTTYSYEIPQKYFGVPSPTVASLGRFVNFPAVKNTGIPEIGMGLFTITEGDIQVPVSLSYHAAGVRVDQEASWVGMNWALQTGGVISRTVMDIPDDRVDRIIPFNEVSQQYDNSNKMEYYGWLDETYAQYNLSNMQTWPDNFNGCDNLPGSTTTFDGVTYTFSASQVKAYCIIPRLRSSQQYIDTEPDVYMVNVNGISVKFIFDRNRNIRLLGNQDVKIEAFYQHQGIGIFTDYNIASFIVTDNMGTKYEFSAPELTTTTSRSAHYYLSGTYIDHPAGMIFGTLPTSNPFTVSRTYTSAWMLTKITSVTGQTITYSYGDRTISYSMPLAEFRNACDNAQNIGNRYPTKMALDMQYSINAKTLTTITTSTQTINFTTSAREDLSGDVKLDEIVIRATKSATGIDVIKKFRFNYTYTYSSCDNTLNYNSSFNSIHCQDVYRKRLFLASFQEKGQVDTEVKQPYVFTYNSISLPAKYSPKQDFWGYYNNNSSTGSMLPEIYVYPTYSGADRYRVHRFDNPGFPNPIILPGQDRKVNYNVNQAGVLIKVQYPTGGWSEYEYESNDYFDPVAQQTYLAGGLRIKKIRLVESATNAKIIEKQYSYNKIEAPTVTSGILVAAPQHAYETAWGDNPNTADPVLGSSETVNPYPMYSYNTVHTGNNYFYGYSYRVNCVNNGGVWTDASMGYNAVCSYDAKTDPNLTDYDRWNIFTRRFSYSLLPLSNLDGMIVQYTNVTVKETGLGKTVTEYAPPMNYRNNASVVDITATTGSLFGNVPAQEISLGEIQRNGINSDGKNIYPFPPMSYNEDEINGELLNEMTYDESGKLLKNKTYQYTFVRKTTDNIVYALKLAISNAVTLGYPFNSLAPYHYSRYRYYVDQEPYVSSVIENTYSMSDNNFIEEKTEYTYSTRHTKPVTIKNTNSDGTLYTILYRYPSDIPGIDPTFGGDNGVLRTMNEDNIKNLPVEVISYIKEPSDVASKIAGAVSYRYSYPYAVYPERRLQLNEIYSTEFASPIDASTFMPMYLGAGDEPSSALYSFWDEKYIQKVYFELYDVKRNPLQLRKTGDVPTCMLWAYNNTLLIANIANATADKVAYTNFDSRESGNGWIVDPSACRHDLVGGLTPFNGKYYVIATHGSNNDPDVFSSTAKPQGSYKLTFWAESGNTTPVVNITGGNKTLLSTFEGKQATATKKWKLYEYQVDITSTTGIISITLANPVSDGEGNNIYTYVELDEVRLYPLDAMMATYAYEPGIGKTAEISPNHTAIYYEYDLLNRLKLIKDRDGNIIKRYTYNYKQ